MKHGALVDAILIGLQGVDKLALVHIAETGQNAVQVVQDKVVQE